MRRKKSTINHQTVVNVNTRAALKAARVNGTHRIIITGKLAAQVKVAQKVTSLSKKKIVILSLLSSFSVATSPVTGGLSSSALIPIAASTGIPIAALIAAILIGFTFILALFRDYEIIEYSDNRLILRKKG